MKETACFELGGYLSEGANGAFGLSLNLGTRGRGWSKSC